MVSPREEPRRVLEPLPTHEQAAQPGQRVPWVCGAVIALSGLLFVMRQLQPEQYDLVVRAPGMVPALVPRFGLYGPLVQAGEFWRLLTCAFEHGGALHLFFNMSVVFSLGFGMERAIGSARFAFISLVSAIGASAFSLFFNWDIPMVGASGMILGWAGAMLLIVTREGRRSLGIWLVQIAVISLLPGVSWAGHLGGFLFGLPCGLALKGGARAFRLAVPVILFLTAIVAVLAASGRYVYR